MKGKASEMGSAVTWDGRGPTEEAHEGQAEPEPRILVTGAMGFIGSQALHKLRLGKARPWSLDLRPITAGKPAPREILADLSRPGPWQEQVRGLGFTHVLHLAGLPRSRDPKLLQLVHVEGTARLIEALKGSGAWLLLASSSAVYGALPSESFPITEDADCRPIGPYAQSKLAQEQVALDMSDAAGLCGLCIVRLSNPIGPGQEEGYFLGRMVSEVARLARQPAREREVLQTGSLASTRDFIDLRDAVRAMLMLMESRAAGVFNVASGQETRLRDLVAKIAACHGVDLRIQEDETRFSNPIPRQALSIRAIEERVGWLPRHCIEDSLGEICRAKATQLQTDPDTSR